MCNVESGLDDPTPNLPVELSQYKLCELASELAPSQKATRVATPAPVTVPAPAVVHCHLFAPASQANTWFAEQPPISLIPSEAISRPLLAAVTEVAPLVVASKVIVTGPVAPDKVMPPLAEVRFEGR